MSQTSPHARSISESRLNRKTTAVFLSLVAAIIAGLWLIDPSLFNPDPVPPKPPYISGKTNPPTDIADATENSRIAWSVLIAAIEQELPDSRNSDLAHLKERLQSVARVLTGTQLSPEPEGSIKIKLDEMRKRAVVLSAQADRRSIVTQDLSDALNSSAQSILTAEEAAIRQAVEQAGRKIHEDLDPAIRKMRLSVREQQDKATKLRQQITQMQREQAATRGKSARLNSLRTDMADVDRYLKPFTSPGHLQPISDRNPWNVKRTADAKPVSLAALKRLGALENTMEGIERLYIFGGGRNEMLDNARPLGSFPQYWAQQLDRKPEVLNAVKRAQQLLRKHGQALVEERLLSE